MLRPEEMAFLNEQMRMGIKKNRLAYTETVKKTITWDGDMAGKYQASNWIKITDTPIKATEENFSRIELTNGENNITFETCVIEVIDDEKFIHVTVAPGEELPLVKIMENGNAEFPIGTYFVDLFESNLWVSLCEIIEKTIHPIPQEYIPPLDALYLNGTDGVRYKLYVDAAGQLQVEVV